ncbi:TatD family hydrolase [Adhaeretor mobilis]|uniref:Putative deoxyribonuclease YcfH n=1 Tax=Adhaeretor mobilis TaxID=1930276 RepID=A0A517MUZ7_9BACT|nr:TatD family hydrolase [Adhaeretor mobilis]QDS98710.1 putative deoxyribonuclease YcfH [Adhaeretor mobilis]
MLFDTHTHLNQKDFDDNRDEVVARAREAGVTRMAAVGVSVETSQQCVHLANQYDEVLAVVGIQPNYVAEAKADDWQEIEKLAKVPGVVAIGETGLDRHWDDSPFDMQQDYFDRHMRLAEQHQLPFVVHMRDCDEDILVMLREAYQRGPLKGIMHSFTGSADMAAECVAMGMHISFAGMVTFKKSQDLRDCAASVPLDRLLVETDCPYLSPEPLRGKRPNEPARVKHTAECIAKARGIPLKELAAATTSNACGLFGLC